MKLHLPTRLRAAVLACITAVAALSTTIGTGVVTVGSVTYVMAASQAQAVEYSGTIYTYTGTGNVSAGPYVQTNYDSGTGTFSLTETSTTGWNGGALSVNSIIGNVDANAVHHTVRFTAGSGREVTLDFAPLTVAGFIVDEGASGYSITYGGGNRDRHVDIGNSDEAHTAAYSSIKEDFTLNVSASTSTDTVITLKGTQTWDIAAGKTMTLTAPSSTTVRVLGSSAVSLMGGGTMNVTNSLTLSLAGLTTDSQPLITVAEGTTLQYGSIALTDGADLAVGVYSLVSTTAAQATAMATALNMTSGRFVVAADGGLLKLTVQDGALPVTDVLNVAYGASTSASGYEVLSGGNLKINNGSGSAGGAAAGAVSNIGPVTVNEGGTLTVWAWQQSKRTLQTDDKVSIASNITLNGGKVFIEDGSYNFTGTVAVSGNSTFESQYAKGYTFSSLTGGADAVLTIQQDSHDANCATLVNILNANADFAGTVNLKNVHAADSPVALDLVLSNASALSNAKLSFDAASTSPNNLVLNTESASLVALSGTGNIISSNEITGATAGSVAAATLTVTNASGTYAGNISDHIGMVIAGGNQTLGAVTLNGTLTVNAGATLTLNGALDLHHAIVNNGTVALDSGVQFDLSHLTATAEGVYTLFEGSQAVNLSSLGTANVVSPAAGYNYVFSDNGTVQAVLLCQDLTWSGGALDWHVGSVMNDEKAFAAGDMVTFNTADAAVTVSENITSAKVTVDSGVTAALTGTGQTLTVGELAVNGTLSLDNVSLSTSGMALAGELVLKSDNALAEGTALKNSGTNAVVTIAGAVQSGNARFGTFAGKIRVADGGTLTLVGANGFGATSNTIVVDAGGVLENNGVADCGYTITLNGGSLINTGAGIGTGKKQFAGLNVTADSTIGGTSQFGVIAGGWGPTTVALNGNTLTKVGTNTVNFAHTTVTAGVLRIAEGEINMFQNNGSLNCDLDIAGGSLTGANTAMSGNHTIAATGTGGTIGCALTSTGAVTVDTAADAALNITGNLTAVGFSKLGEGSLTMSNLAVSKQLAMNYEGSLTLTAVSVAADTVLSYAGTGSVISLSAEAVQGALTIDVIKLTAEQLAAGVNLGISSSVTKDSLTVAGLNAADYTIESHENQWWLTATKAVETPWDKNWDSLTLVKAPATVVQGSLTETTGLYGNATYDNGTDTIAISLTGEGGATVEIYGGANSDANNAGGTVTRNTWIEAKSGTYAAIVGGNLCNNWSAGSVWHLTGDTHIMIDGATVTNVIGGLSKDAKTPSLTGNTYVSVVSGSVTGSIVGGSTNAHNNTTNLMGDTHVFVYTPVAAKIIGGGQRVANDARCTNTINGNTNVIIQTNAAGEFAGRIVAGTESDGGLQNQTVNGNTNLTIDAASATFAESIIGGHFNSYSGGSGDSATSKIAGSANTVLNSGTYNGVVIGGSSVNDHGAWGQFLHSEIAKINLTINGGTYNNTIYGGSVSNCIKNTSYTNNGAIALNLNGGTINGDIYAAGEQSGTKAVTASSVTVTVEEDVTIAENHTLSGGYKVNEGGNASVATVEGGSSLILNGGTRTYTGVTVKDFTSVTVSSAEATVTTGALSSEGSITKLGAGALAVAEGSSAASLAVNAGSLTLSGANTITALSVASGASLDMSAATALGGALTLAEGATLVTSTADSAMGVTGLNITSGMTLSIAGAAAGYSDAIKLFSGLTTDTITGLTFADEAGVMVADISGIITVSGVSSDYNRVVLNDGTLSLVSTAAPAEELTWLGGDGTWGGDSTPWTGEGGQSAYVAGAAVTIGGDGGATGGTITVSGDQTAASLTIAESGYSIQRAASGQNSLTVTGALTVKEGVSFSSAFLPTVGSIALEEGSELFFNNADYVGLNGNLQTILGKVTEESTGTLKMSGGPNFNNNVSNRVDLNGGDLTISGVAVVITENVAFNAWNRAEGANVNVESSLTVADELRMESNTSLNIANGGSVTVGTLGLGHTQSGNPGHLVMEEGSSLTAGSIASNAGGTTAKPNVMEVNGGTLTITGETAFSGTGVLNVNVGAATITNGTTNMAFNHASTLTDATITATPEDADKGITQDTTITVGGTGMTTTIAKADSAQSASLTTNGNVVIDGTTSVSGATTLTSNGSLTVNSLSATEGTTLTTAGTGSTTISAGSVDKIVANGTTTLGNVTVKNISGTITQATGTTLTLADGATLDGTASIGTATAAGSLTKTGTGTVTTGAITGTNTALTVSGGTLSTGAVSNLTTVSVAQGATLASTGDVTATGAATINGTFNGGSLTATSITVAEGASIGLTSALTATKTAQENTGVVTLNDSITLGALTADTVTLAADKTLTVSGEANITNLALGSIGETPAVSFGSLTSSAMAVDVAITTLHDYFDTAAEGTTSVTIATLGAASAATLSLVNDKGGGYDYSIALDSFNNIVISRNYSGIVWDGTSGAEWGQGGSWQGGNVPGAADNVSFIGNEGTAVTPTVTIAAGGVTAGSVSVTGSEAVSADYTFTGGSLTAADLLVENGSLSIENESAFNSGSVEATGSLTVNDAAASLEIGTLTVKGELTIEDGELTVTDTLTTEEDATLAFNGGSSAIGTAAMGSDTIVIKAPASVLVGTMEGEETTVQLAGALNVVKGDIKKIEGIADGGSTTYGDLTVGAVQSLNSLTPTVTNDVAIAEASDVQNLTVTGTGNLAAQDTLHIHGTADVAENGVVTVAKNTTIDGTLTNNGDITIGSETAPATLATAQVTNDGTITVYNTMTATGDVTNKSGAELDVKGALTANEAGKTVENSGTLTVGGATKVTSLTTNAGGTTEAKAGATIGTTLTNHGKTTITGNLVSADTTETTPGSLVISNDATGSGEKLVVSGNVSGASLTTETGATTEISGTATLSGIDNSGTLSTGALTTETLTNNGTLNVTGNAAVKDLSSTNVASQMNVTGTLTIAQGGSLNSDGDITASSLNLSNLAATDKVTVGDLKTDAITLNALSSATEGLTVESLSAKTPGQKVTVSLADSIVDQIASLDESDTAQLVTVTSPASTGKLQLTTAAAQKITTALDKKLLTYAISENGKLTILDNALDKGMLLSENAQAGMDMVKEAYIAEGGTPTGDLKEITDLLKTYRADNNQAAAEKLTSALSGASVAALGSALSGDVERQLKAIRNRTTVMGVNQAVVNEGMPYVNAWMNAEGDYRDISADGTMPGYKMTSWGGTVGFDVDCTPRFTCGLAATAMYGDFDSTGDDHATGDLNTYYVSAFGRYASHRWTHTFVATAGLADTSLDRTVDGVKVKGDSEGSMFGGMYEVGYVFALDKEATTCLQPIFNVSYTHATLNGYEETGSDIALKTGDVEMNKLTLGLGARLQSVIGENIYNRSSLFEARALVKFDAGDRQGEVTNSFVKYAGSGTAKSVETGAVGGEFGVGLTVPVGAEGGNIFVDASAEIRADYVNVNGTVGYRVNF